MCNVKQALRRFSSREMLRSVLSNIVTQFEGYTLLRCFFIAKIKHNEVYAYLGLTAVLLQLNAFIQNLRSKELGLVNQTKFKFSPQQLLSPFSQSPVPTPVVASTHNL